MSSLEDIVSLFLFGVLPAGQLELFETHLPTFACGVDQARSSEQVINLRHLGPQVYSVGSYFLFLSKPGGILQIREVS